MKKNKTKNYSNNQEYIKLQDEIYKLNLKLKDLYDKKNKIRLYDEKMSKINKMYLLLLVTFEIFFVILTKGALLIIQSFIVAGLSFIGFDSSRGIYREERKLKADNPNIDMEIENTEGELKIARNKLNDYVKSMELKEEKNNEKRISRAIEYSEGYSNVNDRPLQRKRVMEKDNNE